MEYQRQIETYLEGCSITIQAFLVANCQKFQEESQPPPILLVLGTYLLLLIYVDLGARKAEANKATSFGPSGLRAFGPSGLRAFGPSGLRAFGPSGLRAFGPSLQFATKNVRIVKLHPSKYRVAKTIFSRKKCLYLFQLWSYTKILEYGKVWELYIPFKQIKFFQKHDWKSFSLKAAKNSGRIWMNLKESKGTWRNLKRSIRIH